MASCVKAFPRRQIKSDSTLPRAAHLAGGLIGRHQCITSHSASATQPTIDMYHSFPCFPCLALVLLRSSSGVFGHSTTQECSKAFVVCTFVFCWINVLQVRFKFVIYIYIYIYNNKYSFRALYSNEMCS